MFHVPDWKQVQQRYADFWDHKLKGRAIMNLACPYDGPEEPGCPAKNPPTTPVERWLDTDRIHQNFLHDLHHVAYIADGYPRHFVNIGPGYLAPMIGGSFKLAPDTVWFENEQVIRDYATDLDLLYLRTEEENCRIIAEMTRWFVELSDGRYIISMTDLGGTADVAAALRGTETLLCDLYDNPDGVTALLDRVDELWQQAYDYLYGIFAPSQNGASDAWLSAYCDGRYSPLQCDFSAMISTEQFDRFVMPSLQRQCDFLDHSAYHLDGPDAIRHLPSLLSIPNLDAIQWVPGTGNPGKEDPCWYPMYRQIQDAGKALILNGLNEPHCRKAFAELDQSLLCMSTFCESRAAAEDLVRFAEDHA